VQLAGLNIEAKSYGSEMTLFDAAKVRPSWGHMNGYAEDHDAFSFCPAADRGLRKMVKCCAGSVTSQDYFTALQL
jgi:hypothetical protein